MSNDLRSLVDALRDQNWAVKQVSGTRYRATPPGAIGNIVDFNANGIDRGVTFMNIVRDLKRAGAFQWPPLERRRRRLAAIGTRTLQPAPGEEDLFPSSRPSADVIPIREEEEEETPPSEPAVEVAPEKPSEMDVIARLKEARDYLRLANEDIEAKAMVVRSAAEALEAAQAQLQKAKQDRKEAASNLKDARAAFLAAFDDEEGDQDEGE